MNTESDPPDPVELLQNLGLKEYEARCFVALTRMRSGTARDVSDTADVPRTRVYDAVNELQSSGLVDVQHSKPQQFRAIPVDDAVRLLRQRFERRFESLHDTLLAIEPIGEASLKDDGNVWTTSGSDAVDTRAIRFIDSAEEEVVLVIDGLDEESVSDELIARLSAAADRGVSIYIGTLTESTYEQVTAEVPAARTFESGLEWLQPQTEEEDERIGRLLLADRSALLLSSVGSHSPEEETAIWSDSVGSGLLVLARRLLASGLDREAEDLGERPAGETGERQ